MKTQRLGGRHWFGFLLVMFALLASAAPGFAACQEVTVSASYFSSWDTYGVQNRIRRSESNVPDSVVGRGPYSDRYAYEKLRVSRNVVGFYMPPVTGVVVNAELRLRVRYLVSLRGSELYQWRSISNPRVKLAIHQYFGSNVYDDPDDTLYGAAPVTLSDSVVSIPLNNDLIALATAAGGKWFLMEGSLATLDADPLNQQYLYLDTDVSNYAVLALTLGETNAPQISVQPTNRVANEGTEAELHVVACGTPPISYQWRYADTPIPGATNPSLLLQNLGTNNAGPYSVILSNAAGVVTSAVAQLTVNRIAPFFGLHPYEYTLSAESSGSMRVVAGGAPLPTYQWQFNGTNLPGATNNVLRWDFVTPENAGTYTVVANNSSGSVTSNPALLSVVPFFFYNWSIGNTWLDNPVTLYVGYSGYAFPTELQWFHNNMPVAGGNDFSLSFVATPATAGEYFLVGQNQYGTVTSTVINVTVQALAPIFSTPLSPAIPIAGLPATFYVSAYGGSPPVFFWYRNGVPIPNQNGPELHFASVSPSDAGSYSVVASNQLGMVTSGPVTVSVIAGYVSISPSSASAGEGSPVVFRAYYQGVPAVSYQWRLNGQILPGETNSVLFMPYVLASMHSGDYTVSASNSYGGLVSSPAHLYVSQSPAVVYLPAFVQKRTGDFVWLTGSFYGAPPPVCQWQFNGIDIPGATNYVLALSSVSTQQAGIYTVMVSNGVLPTASFTQELNLQITARGPLDDWTFLNPRPQANPLRAVAFGNGRRIAVGENGAVLVSSDGQTWTTKHLGKGIHLKAVAYGNGLFVAAGNAEFNEFRGPVIFTSPDGLTWTARDVSAQSEIAGLAFGNGVFVAVGAFTYQYYGIALIFTSTDGVSWQKRYLGGDLTGAILSAITFGNGRFVAVSDGNFSGGIISSTDGVDWTETHGAEGRNYEAVCAGAGQFVAVGDNGVATRSADGLNWTVGSVTNVVQLKAVAFGNGTYVAAGDFGNTFTSSDGVSWTPISFPSAHDVSALVFGGGQLTAVGDAGRILVSSNGVNWADQCVGPDLDLYALAKGPPGYVAVGEGGLQFSADRTNWTVISTTYKLHGVIYANGMYVVVGKKGTILISTDGLTWTQRSSGVSEYIEHVIWANNRFVAVGEKGLMVTSTDGITWTVVPPATLGDIEDMAYGNGIFVGVGGYFDPFGAITTVITSTNGTDWQNQPSVGFFGTRARGVAFGGGRFVLVGNDGLSAVSTNGKAWSDAFRANDNFRAVTYTSGRFIAVGNDGLLMSSVDGITWIDHRCVGSMNLRDVQVDSDGLLAVGSNGTLLKSEILQPQLLARRNGSGFELDLRGGLAPQYYLQRSSDFHTWNNVMNYSNSAPVQYLDRSGAPVQFYRIVPAQ